MLKPQEGILRSPSDANSGIGGFASAFAELARAVTDDIKSRQDYLDDCIWLTPEQKEKIKITPEYIEIDGIRLKLHDEPETMNFDGFKDIAPNKKQWESIIKFLANGNIDAEAGFSGNIVNFFTEVLKMDKRFYGISTECRDNYTLETYQSGPKYRVLDLQKDYFIGTEGMNNQDNCMPIRALAA